MASPTRRARTHTVETACPLDCPDSCSLLVTVEEGRIRKIDGSRRHAITDGYICAKVRRFAERVYGSSRIPYPAVRTGPKGQGVFSRVSWAEAIAVVAGRLGETRNRWGGEAILPCSYGGSNGLLTQDTSDARLFRLLGSSRLDRTVCAAPTGAAAAALYGRMPSVSYPDYEASRLIVIWGANPSVSGIHLVPYIQRAQAQGASLVVIDPRVTPLARKADLHLPVEPGTDLAVALAVHRHLFEGGGADLAFLDRHTRGAERLRARAADWTFERAGEVAGVQPALIERVAHLYAATSPAVIRCGWGLERNRNGGSAAAAVLALPAVGGKFGVRGGGYTMSNSAAWGLEPSWIGVEEPPTRRVNMNHLGRVLDPDATPPVKLLFVYNCNPAVTLPDQNRLLKGLAREDLFTVVFDQVMTDTAAYADVVLPATTFLETYDLARAYGPISLQMVQPVIDAVGEARSNPEVFSQLSTALGLDDEVAGDQGELGTLMWVLAALPDPLGEVLRDGQLPVPACGANPVQFVDVRPGTPDGLVDLCPASLDEASRAGLYRYIEADEDRRHPLALISPASDETISSTLGELPRRDAALVMHPIDAHQRQLGEGDNVRVFNDLGEVRCPVSIEPTVRPGTVVLPKGLWRASTANRSTATALAPDTLSDIGGGACFNDARVQVERVVN